MRLHNIEDQKLVTPKLALDFLVEGNKRFVENLKAHSNLLEQVNSTKEGQFPFAIILSCIDSRTSAELIFDQGLGDIFSARIAGNVLNEDIIGSMEFACKLAGSKLIMVLGHSHCGAITGACKGAKLGHLTNLLAKVEPSIEYVKENNKNLDIESKEAVDLVAYHNVDHTIDHILSKSTVLSEMYQAGEIGIVGAFYKVETGEVNIVKEMFVEKNKTMAHSDFYKKILERNKQWVEERLTVNPNYFKRLSEKQTPPVLWIGCSDSRVPANEIIGAEPGDVFVHRNIANMVIHSDMNMLSVLDYAVNILKIKDIIVCGHYGCGGVLAAMKNESYGLIDNWIRHIKTVYRLHNVELDQIDDEVQRFNRFVELNVQEQVYDLAKTSIVQEAWSRNQELGIHGWVYGLNSGYVTDLNVNLMSNQDLDEVYQLRFRKI